MGMMEHDILKVLYTEEEIKARVRDLGARMYEDLKDKDPLFVSVLRGAFIFMADIVRACQVKCDVEFIAVSSYGNATSSSGAVQITHDIQQDISGHPGQRQHPELPQAVFPHQGGGLCVHLHPPGQAQPPDQGHYRRLRGLCGSR